jgi:hypothetical protein
MGIVGFSPFYLMILKSLDKLDSAVNIFGQSTAIPMDQNSFILLTSPPRPVKRTRTEIKLPGKRNLPHLAVVFLNDPLGPSGKLRTKYLIRVDKQNPVVARFVDDTGANLLNNWITFVMDDLVCVRRRNLDGSVLGAEVDYD